MFQQFFTLPRTVARHRAGPLLEERLRYLQHLARPVPSSGRIHTVTVERVAASKVRVVFAQRGTWRSGRTEIEIWKE